MQNFPIQRLSVQTDTSGVEVAQIVAPRARFALAVQQQIVTAERSTFGAVPS